MFAFRDSRGRVDVAFTDRHGEPRGGPFAWLDLAEPAVDAPQRESDLAALEVSIDVVAHALARCSEARVDSPSDPSPAGGLPTVVRMRQVHGADVHVVEQEWLDSGPEQLPVADGLVTDLPGVALLVRVADCVPVLLADPGRGVVGAAHAGRVGLVRGVVPATVARMRELGAERVHAWVGPRICGACYEVPAQMRAEVGESVPEALSETSWGTPALDIGAGVTAQLEAAGVDVVDTARCTREDERLYSHRREGARAGRLGGLVWVRP